MTASATATIPSFRLTGPLPTGTTVLEASAGTGKTYAIAALATRMIAEGEAELSQLMMVTFGRMATNELRLRVRERLARTERQLARHVAGADVGADAGDAVSDVTDDDLERLLADAPAAVVAERHGRIRAALADFDAATIATTHEFCQTMLAGLGLLGDHESDAGFTESLSDLTREVAAEAYLRRFAVDEAPPPFDFDTALGLAEAAVGAGPARLVPGVGAQAMLPWEQRVAFASEVVTRVGERKRERRLYSYDDMLSRLQACLADPVSGAEALSRLRSRYRVVLVDEFQDTDPVQWDIVRRAFHSHARLILIGDPKQAIYAFRGADVFSYLDAVTTADTVATLDTNWRSDAALVDALGALMADATLGDPRIAVRPVQARHREPRLRLPAGRDSLLPGWAPVRLRVGAFDPEAEDFTRVAKLRDQVAADLATDVAALLDSGAELCTGSVDDPVPAWRPVNPGDIAVLVRNNKRLEEIRSALAARGVPAVVRGAGSVFASDVAAEWLRLLNALEQPRQTLIRDIALTRFVGWDVQQLVHADEDDLNRLAAMVRRWSRVLAQQGVAALQEAVTGDTRIAERLLSEPGGERSLTDLRHVGENLHAAMTTNRLGVGALIAWLRERITEARRTRIDDVSRRLESDGEAVQILTIHRSKGLEFPIVYLPDAWDRYVSGEDDGRTLRVHDPLAETGGPGGDDLAGDAPGEDRRDPRAGLGTGVVTRPGGAGPIVLDVGGERGPGRRDRIVRAREEDAGEDLRLGYVALTRARCQVVTWWMPSRNTAPSALQRFLFRAPGEDAEPRLRYEVTADPRGLPRLDQRLFSVELLEPRPSVDWESPTPPTGRLGVRTFDRALDLSWRRTSYSALTAAAHGLDAGPSVTSAAGSVAGGASGVGSEPEGGKEDDESAAVAAALELGMPDGLGPTVGNGVDTGVGGDLGPGPDDPVSPMDALPLGAAFGTVVHALLEEVDPQSTDLRAELIRLARAELARGPAGSLSAETLGEALVPALQTPLGPLAGDRRLCDIARSDRLPELTFELPLAGGDEPRAAVTLGDCVPVLRRHLGPGDPLHRYPDLLELPMLAEQPLRGYLNGSIDAVLRIRGAGDHDIGSDLGRDDRGGDGATEPRYLVVDYKTNWLGSPELRPLRVGRYTPALMAAAMMQAHYPLQALLYSVALHRYLRWRQPGYDADVHLGGVLYLFLRGMAGAQTPRVDGVPCGVFSWRPAPELIIELSDLLDGVRR